MASTPVKLPSGSWRSVAYLGRDENGKQIRKSFTAPSKREAFNLAREYEATAQPTVMKTDEQLTLGEAIDKFIQLKEPVLSPATVKGYRSVRRNYLQELMDAPVCELTSTAVQQAISDESLTKSPKTIRNIYGLLTATLKQFYPDINLRVRLPQKQKDEIIIPSLEDIEKLIEAADPELSLAIMFGAQLGLRRSEICALTFGDIKNGAVTINKAIVVDKDKVWRIKPPKSTAGYRTLPLTEQLTERLSGLHGNSADRILSISPDIVTRRFERLQVRLGIMPFRFHDLRHYNASVMISLGIPTLYITRRLGHSSPDMVNRVYGHLIADKQEDINRKMNAFFK